MKWFKHDSDAHRNKKLRKLQIKYGFIGTGLYWHCLELIAQGVDKHNLTFELEHDAEILAHEGKIETRLCEEIMKYMVELGLFESSRGQITCMKLAARIENSIVKSPELRAIQQRLQQLEIAEETRAEKAIAVPDNPGPSRTIPDDSGKLGNCSEKVGLDIDLELDNTTTTTAYISREWAEISPDFKPNTICTDALHEHLVPDWFIESYREDFVQYWLGTGTEKLNWHYVFFEQCRDQWRKRAPPNGSANGRGERHGVTTGADQDH